MIKKKKTGMLKSLAAILISSPSLRLDISLHFGLLMNIVYIAENLASAIIYKSAWSATVTVYHFLFVAIRAYVIRSRRLAEMGETSAKKTNQICIRVGIILLALDLSALALMLYTIPRNTQAEYSGLMLFGFFIYTVYSLASSLFGVLKWSNDNKSLHFAAVSIAFTAALMSLFNLQYSFLLSLGLDLRLVLQAGWAGGTAIFCIIIFLACRLIAKGSGDRDAQNS